MPVFPGGSRSIDHGEGSMSRASGAHVPDDGRQVANNVPRVTPQRIPRNTWRPKVYFSHDPSLTKMRYQASQDPLNNLVDRENTFIANFPEFTKVQLGTSFEGRAINAFRLGPVSRKHFVVVLAVHGNEIDGVEGTFKAFEILAREPEFQAFRDEWTLFLVTAMNPDGWFNGLRNLAQVGPNGKTINLNRNWNWFWDEYVETGFESKGSAAESTVEAQAILNYHRGTGPFTSQGAVEFGFLMDQHANQGVGKRYQSRDRIWRGPTQGPASDKDLNNAIPGSYLTVYIDFYTWRSVKALTKIRANENEGAFDYDVSYRRSRFRPHLHSYFSSQAIPSIAIEEVKVDNAFNNLETYASAADFRLDYTLSCAAMVTSDFWVWEDAVLVENSGSNILKNSHFEQWQTDDTRPGNYTTSRSLITRNPNVLTSPATVRHFDDSGEAMTMVSNTDVRLRANSASADVPSEYTRSCNLDFGVYCTLSPEMSGLFKFDIDAAFAAGFVGSPDLSISRTQKTGVGLHYGIANAVDIIGGGTAAPSTGAVTTITRISALDTDTPVEANVGNLNTARMFHASADNFLDFPTSGDQRVFIFGGWNTTPSRVDTIEVWNPDTVTSTTSGANLPGTDGLTNACAVFHPPTGKVFIFGGSDNSVSYRTAILEYTPGATPATDTITTHGTSMLVGLTDLAGAYSPKDGRIWLFGGEISGGDMSDKIYSFDPTTGNFVEEAVSENLDDDEDNHDVDDDDGQSLWVREFGRWSAVTNVESTTDTGLIQLPGGLETSTAGAKSADVYQFDPIDEIIGLQRLSDYGYWRYSVAVAEREYNVGSTADSTLPIKVSGVSGKTFIGSGLTFSPSGVTADFLELTESEAGDTILRVKNLSGIPDTADTVSADASTETFSASVESVPKDDFSSTPLNTDVWDDTGLGWSIQGGELIVAGEDKVLLLENDPDWENQKITFDLRKNGSDVLEGDFSVVVRASYNVSDVLQDGYKIAYREGTQVWRIDRLNGAVVTALDTLDVTADSTRQITETAVPVEILIEDRDPVKISVTYNGLSIFDIVDLDNDRIRTPGRFAFEGRADV